MLSPVPPTPTPSTHKIKVYILNSKSGCYEDGNNWIPFHWVMLVAFVFKGKCVF